MTSFTCTSCNRSFGTQRGLNIHRASCKVIASQNNNDQLLCIQNVDVNLPINIIMEENEGTIESMSEFMWGEKPSNVFTHDLNFIYEKVVFWCKNIFKLPSGSAGKNFIKECTRLVTSWTSKSAIRPIALKCLMIMPALLLKKPSKDSKSKNHVEALKRRLDLWGKAILLSYLKKVKLYNIDLKHQHRLRQQKRFRKNSPSS